MKAPTELIEQAFRLANAAVVADIESYCTPVHIAGWKFWDTRNWTDLREHAPQEVDMAKQAIDYAVASGLAMHHPQQRHLLRIHTKA